MTLHAHTYHEYKAIKATILTPLTSSYNQADLIHIAYIAQFHSNY
jgi:hypothetical protein